MCLTLLCLLLAVPLTGFASAPKKPKVTVVARAQAGVVWVVYKVTASGGATGLVVTITPSGQTPAPVSKNYATSSKTDSVSFPRPAVLATISGTLAAVAVRRGLPSLPTTQPWSYTEPDVPPPPPVIDSIRVAPASFTVEATKPGVVPLAKNQQEVCAFVVFHGGHVAFRQVESTKSTCLLLYGQLPMAARMVSTAEQAVADRVCIDWKATGGTITPETCGPNPAMRFDVILEMAGT